MSKLDDILLSQDLGYIYKMSDYATSSAEEYEMEQDGLDEVKATKEKVKQLFLEIYTQQREKTRNEYELANLIHKTIEEL